ncbi:MAG: hypothetical protein QOH48_1113 [Actinomycetota bacterium]|nr:hypothetical protein [Actinomycetota bacterium]
MAPAAGLGIFFQMKGLIVLLALALTVFTACDRSGDQAGPPSPSAHNRPSGASPPQSPATSTGQKPSSPATPSLALSTPATQGATCKNQRSIPTERNLFRPGSLRGDVTGDGAADVVRIAVDPGGPADCSAFVVVESSSGAVAAAIPQWEPTPALPAPHLNSLVRIDAAAGDEIVIDVTAGASTQFEGVYTYSEGRVLPLAVTGIPFTGLFPYGGSVGHLDGQACTSGMVVVSSALVTGPTGLRYAVVRRFFRPGDGELLYAAGRTQHLSLRSAALSTLPEFSDGPFAGC